MGYIVHTSDEQREMLRTMGLETIEQLLAQIPQEVRLNHPMGLNAGLSEMETLGTMRALAAQNQVFRAVLRGAGSYAHYIPPLVPSLANRHEFLTSYTPYQSEFSQGNLQSILSIKVQSAH